MVLIPAGLHHGILTGGTKDPQRKTKARQSHPDTTVLYVGSSCYPRTVHGLMGYNPAKFSREKCGVEDDRIFRALDLDPLTSTAKPVDGQPRLSVHKPGAIRLKA